MDLIKKKQQASGVANNTVDIPKGGETRLGEAGRKDSPHNIKYRQQQLMELKRKMAGQTTGRPVRNATGPYGRGMGPGGGRADGSGLL